MHGPRLGQARIIHPPPRLVKLRLVPRSEFQDAALVRSQAISDIPHSLVQICARFYKDASPRAREQYSALEPRAKTQYLVGLDEVYRRLDALRCDFDVNYRPSIMRPNMARAA